MNRRLTLAAAFLFGLSSSLAIAAEPPVAGSEPPMPEAEPIASPAPSPPPAPVSAPGGRVLSHSVDLGASAAEVFRGFTTSEGIVKSWSVAKAKVDFRVGGQIRTCYQPDGDLDAPTAIVNTILAYEPDRMLAIKATAPDGAPAWLQKICASGWSVLRLEPLGADRCRLTITGMGYGVAGADPELDTAFAFFEKGNKWTMDKLKALYPIANDPEPLSPDVIELDRFVASGPVAVDLHKEAVVNAPPEEVFRLWTTREGFKSFLGVESNVDLRIGGPMELYFGPNNPPGERGSDGCQILSYLPGRMLSYSWNAPPKFPDERQKRSWVVIHFTPVEDGKTRVELDHLGFGPHGQGHWDETRAYFDNAWPRVLQALTDYLAK